jgi:membrane-associated phospholipid phosphatase
LRWPLIALALLIGWGAIYSGGHYPLDVLAGYGVGTILGLILVKLRKLIVACF